MRPPCERHSALGTGSEYQMPAPLSSAVAPLWKYFRYLATAEGQPCVALALVTSSDHGPL